MFDILKDIVAVFGGFAAIIAVPTMIWQVRAARTESRAIPAGSPSRTRVALARIARTLPAGGNHKMTKRPKGKKYRTRGLIRERNVNSRGVGTYQAQV